MIQNIKFICQIVQLENINKEKQIDLDKSNQQFERVMEEVTTYKDLIEVCI